MITKRVLFYLDWDIFIVDCQDAVSRRLQVYREITLPMLKSLDEENRLRVVDGDREEVKVNSEHYAHVFLKRWSLISLIVIAKIEI